MYKILNCLKCSAELKEGAKICGNCGEPVPKGLDLSNASQPAKPRKYVIRNPKSLERSKMPGKTKLALVLFVFLPIAALAYFANHFYQTSLVQDDETRILLLKQHLTKLNENEHRARMEVYKRLMDLDGDNKEYLVQYDFHRSQIEVKENKKKKKKKQRPNLRGFGSLAQEIEGAREVFGCGQNPEQYKIVGGQESGRTSFRCPYEENHLVVWHVNEGEKHGQTANSQWVWSGQEVSHKKENGVIQPRPDVEDALNAFANHYAPENVLSLEQAFRESNKGRVVSRYYIFDYSYVRNEKKEFERKITVQPRK